MRTTWALALAAGCSAILAACGAGDAPGDAREARSQAAASASGDTGEARPDTAGAPRDSGVTLRPAPVDRSSCSPYEPAETPAELRPFVPAGREALCAAAADLDGDGREDYVLVVGNVRRANGDAPEDQHEPRALLVLVRRPDGALHEAARGGRAALCLGCGGFFDPFEGVETGPGTFTINHFGGTAWRWRADFTFRYAPDARAWRLERVLELEHHSLAPEKMDSTVYTVPALRPVDLADFEADDWKQALRGRP